MHAFRGKNISSIGANAKHKESERKQAMASPSDEEKKNEAAVRACLVLSGRRRRRARDDFTTAKRGGELKEDCSAVRKGNQELEDAVDSAGTHRFAKGGSL